MEKPSTSRTTFSHKLLESQLTSNADIIKKWSNDLKIWDAPSWFLNFDHGQLSSIYDGTWKLEDRTKEDGIRRRFLRIFYRDILEKICPNSPQRASHTAYKQLAELIHESSRVDHSFETISSNLKKLVSVGRRYHKLTVTFGDGILQINKFTLYDH